MNDDLEQLVRRRNAHSFDIEETEFIYRGHCPGCRDTRGSENEGDGGEADA